METDDFEKRLMDILAGRCQVDPDREEVTKRLRKAEWDFRKALRLTMGCLVKRLGGFKELSQPESDSYWYGDDRMSTYIMLKMRPIPEQTHQIDIDVVIQPNSSPNTVLHHRTYSIHPGNWDDLDQIAKGITLGIASQYAKSRNATSR